jgi:hypothetical protein
MSVLLSASGRKDVDFLQVACGQCERRLDGVAIDDQRGLAEAELRQIALQRLRLVAGNRQIVRSRSANPPWHGSTAPSSAQGANLLQTRVEVADAACRRR